MWILILALILGSAASAYVFMVLILPECRTRDAEEKAAGLLAKEFVEDALHVGGTYTLTTREKGKFGRYLGVIMLSDRTSINAALVSEHLAVPYHGQSKQEVEDAHAVNYEILKEKGLI
jgi:endonuclease YncB( thermonuclease family)